MKIGSEIFYKKKCHNSIEWAKENIDTALDGSIFLADVHEYTRGRQDRIWKNYPGQLKVTILLKPFDFLQKQTCHAEAFWRRRMKKQDLQLRLNQLNMAICLGILQPLKKFNVSLKWPNDFVFEDKKVGGMLIELVWQAELLKGIIVGFAINVNNVFEKTDELHEIATSLHTILNKQIDEKTLSDDLIKSIDEFYQMWINLEFVRIFNLWKKAQSYLGKNIKVHKKDGKLVVGKFDDILPNGDAVLKDDMGRENIIPFFVVENFS